MRAPGRPTKKRKRGVDEGSSKSKDTAGRPPRSRKKVTNVCSRCKKPGHNKASCKGADVGGNAELRKKRKARSQQNQVNFVDF